MITKYLKVWIGNPRGVPPVIRLSQYDTAWRLVFTVYDGAELYQIPSGAAVAMEGRKADGTVFVYAGAIEDGTVTVECGEQMTSARGEVVCELRFSSGGYFAGTANFRLCVEAAPLTGYVASGDDFSAMDQLVSQALAAAGDAREAAEDSRAAAGEAKQEVLEDAPQMVSDWLDANVDPSTGYVIDSSLTVAGAAADAKTAGDAIGKLTKTSVYSLEGYEEVVNRSSGRSIIRNIPVIAGHVYAIFFQTVENSNATSIKIGLTSNGSVDISAQQALEGYTWTVTANTDADAGRVYYAVTDGDGVSVYARITDTTDPFSLTRGVLSEQNNGHYDLYEICSKYGIFGLLGDSGHVSHSTANFVTPFLPVFAGEVIHYYLLGYGTGNVLLQYYDGTTMAPTSVAHGVDENTYVRGSYTVPSDGYIRACCRTVDGESNRPNPNGWIAFESESCFAQKYLGHYYNEIKSGATEVTILANAVDGLFETRFYDASYQYVGKGVDSFAKTLNVKLVNNSYLSDSPAYVEFLVDGCAVKGDNIATMGVARTDSKCDYDELFADYGDINISDGHYVSGTKKVIIPEIYIPLTGDSVVLNNPEYSTFVRAYDEEFRPIGNLGQTMSTTINISSSTIQSAGAKYVKFGTNSAVYPTNLFKFMSGIDLNWVYRLTTDVKDVSNIPNIQYIGALAGYNYVTSGTPTERRINCLSKHKYFTMGFVTDIHGDVDRFDRFANLMNHGVNAANYSANRNSIFDCAICGGDVLHGSVIENPGSYYNGVATSLPDWFAKHAANIKIPFLNTIGNHDVGWTTNVEKMYSPEELYQYYISPTTLANANHKLYGYLDFEDYKIRIVNLYDFDSGIDEIIAERELASLPFTRGFDKMYSQQQIDWLCSTLNSTPEDYTVIILTHTPPIYKDGDYEVIAGFTSEKHGSIGNNTYPAYGYKNGGGGLGLIPDIVKAWIDRTSISATYEYTGFGTSLPSTLDYFDPITVNYDFSNAGGLFGFFLSGHLHQCMAVRPTVSGYTDMLEIMGTTGSCENFQQSSHDDLKRIVNTSMQDAILGLVVNTDEKTVGLVNLGAYVNDSGVEKKAYQISYEVNA